MTTSITTPTAHGSAGVCIVEELEADVTSANPLGFPEYAPPAADLESVRCYIVELDETRAIWIDCDFSRVGGTMGVVAGERIVQAFDRGVLEGLPVVASVGTGGARLQEGMFSLVQMARCSSAVRRHREAGLISAAYLRSPTTGGVWASWASLVDLRAAEPEATIGFGGPRVVEQVTGKWPPEASHTAESAHMHGLVDEIRPVEQMWTWFTEVVGSAQPSPLQLSEGRPHGLRTVSTSDPYGLVQACRSPQSPSGLEWAAWLTQGWVEVKGADPGIRAGIADVGGRRVVVVAMDRHAGHTPLGLPGPAAFGLARRAIELAGRWGLPVLTIVDTSGADPSPESEASGVAREIAWLLDALAGCPTPTVCLTVGEGGSGGAIAMAHTDRHLMLEDAVFAVIGPEAGARVLFRDATRAADVAHAFRLSAGELVHAGLVDEVLPARFEAVLEVVGQALREAVPGDRDRRLDVVTRSVVLQGR